MALAGSADAAIDITATPLLSVEKRD